MGWTRGGIQVSQFGSSTAAAAHAIEGSSQLKLTQLVLAP